MHAESMRIEQLKGGAAIEMVNNELQTVYNDIVNPNKEGKSARKVTLDIVFAPSEDAQVGTCTIRVKSTLGKQRDIGSTVYFGQEKGEGVCTEKDRNQPMFGVMEAAAQQ